MKKRGMKKLDKKLFIAIRELNNDVAIEDNQPPITDKEVLETLSRVKKSKYNIARTLKDYKRYILKL
jgi:hypothetical protein